MDWLFDIAFFAFNFWMVRRARERAAERASSGMSRDPLYITASVLVMVLFGLVAYVMAVSRHAHVPGVLFVVVGGIMIALLVLRRSLKWRYPY